jgi:hypothetical protein
MRNRGIVFSTDLMVAFVAVSAIVFIIVWFSSEYIENIGQNADNFSKEREAVFFMDYLVKTRNKELPSIGAAFFDWEKKRVIGNVLDKEMLKNAVNDVEEIELEHWTVRGIYVLYENGGKEWILGNDSNEGCEIYERFVIVASGIFIEKAKIGAVFCE